ncbi:MAG: hypothetical protein DIZ80_05600 [endosymbiont of Galathealinum brachiosum]|uniref:ABC transporter substrate-binding protein n=1 Tax=endosymbiont of Galathealinum brachiosum TaxID=2200906 RepID=A0A370DJ49_9GAMM|nr:MAG: hypothetical protein DIZ80_05600 [endosymbiont of Galathealinum brachiosum]
MIKQNLRITLLFLIISLLYACAPPVKEEPVVLEPEPVVIPVVVEEPEQEVLLPVQQDVLILLSSSAKAYQKIANHLTEALGEHSVQITLSGLPAQDKAVIKDIKASSTVQIIAIGLKAVEAVKGFKNKQIIYTQVIRHKNLIADNVKGVSSLPSPEKLFKDWKQLSPRLSKVAIIAGKNLELYLARAKKAAKAQKIELIIEQVNSDKGFIYKSKKLKSDVGGQWILPDNQILSGKALKEVMAYASRRGREIVVFSPKLLPFGGFFYINPDLKAVADGILQRLSESAGKTTVSGDSVLPVMSHTMGINQNIARQFNLIIPQEYRKYINGK